MESGKRQFDKAETLEQLPQFLGKASMLLILHDHVLSSTVPTGNGFVLVFRNIMPREVITVRTANRFRT